jgi:hypothetical protein
MPNWCDNTVTLAGDKEVIDKVLEFTKAKGEVEAPQKLSVLSLNSIFPMPEEMKEGDGWYTWSINNWGTKWDVDAYIAHDYEYEGNRYVVISFGSAWAPPSFAIQHLAKAFPEIAIHHSYDEGGMDFSGYDVWISGELVEEVEYGFSVTNAESSMDSAHYFEFNDLDYLKGKVE